jgi:hypothetical protein
LAIASSIACSIALRGYVAETQGGGFVGPARVAGFLVESNSVSLGGTTH